MDSKTNLEWTERTLVPGIADKSRQNVLFADNVSFQLDRAFHEKCGDECNTLVYLLPENQTDKVQPVELVQDGQ